MKMKTLKNNIDMLKYLQISSPFYIIVNIIGNILYFSKYMVQLLFIRFIINYILSVDASLKMITIYFLFYYLFNIFTNMLTILIYNYFNKNEYVKILGYMKNLVYKKVKVLDVSCYDNPEFYDKYNQAIDGVENRVLDSANAFFELFISLLYIISIIAIFTSIDFILIFAALALVLKTIVTSFHLNKINFEKNMAEVPLSRQNSYIYRVFYLYQYTKEMRIFKLLDILIIKFNKINDLLINLQTKYFKKIFWNYTQRDVITILINAIIIIYITYRIIDNQLTIGDFTMILTSVTALANSLTDVFNFITNLKNSNLYINKLNEYLEYEPQIKYNVEGLNITGLNLLSIEFKKVYFSYSESKNDEVLKNISLTLEKGAKIAIVGHNGSGKSTLIKLLMYLYEADNGTIKCNGIELNKYNSGSLRLLFGVVFQDFQMYALTILENILMREKESDDDEKIVWEALEFSGLSEKVKNFENGIYTILTREFDDSGVVLSGGEQQKLAIARAYAQNRPVLILDEPSSALDPLAEKEMFTRLSKLGSDKTVIYISHRLSSTINADCIYLFDNGEIIENGNHKTLMKKQGLYYQMFTAQAEKYTLPQSDK